MRGYINLQAKKKERLLRVDRSASQICPKINSMTTTECV